MGYFFKDESPNTTGEKRFLIRLNFTKVPAIYTTGSYSLLPARLIGLSYADYCRMCRDCFNAEIIGKNSYYLTIYFDSKNADKLISILNNRMELVMKNRKNV